MRTRDALALLADSLVGVARAGAALAASSSPWRTEGDGPAAALAKGAAFILLLGLAAYGAVRLFNA
jgi:hypothetical protein